MSSPSWSVTLILPTVLAFSGTEIIASLAKTGALLDAAAAELALLPDDAVWELLDELLPLLAPDVTACTALAAPAAPHPDTSKTVKENITSPKYFK
jgi:hypothetical protein